MADRSTALVTGANKGIGLEIARGLGKLGYAIWLGCRDPGRGEAAASALRAEGVTAAVLQLDVADDDSVASAARVLGEATDRAGRAGEQRRHLARRRHAAERAAAGRGARDL